jgi:hypothetical protein
LAWILDWSAVYAYTALQAQLLKSLTGSSGSGLGFDPKDKGDIPRLLTLVHADSRNTP